ncbi:3-dehydroquinate synthase family protein [Prochlorococcus sp. MIT 1341]|uniref:3-dehydroquinate synthase n=1 Tax=Prochlorococcus sp. MIT 1341 TaxID=3096221 RepID=UPI002A762A27|nr:3-dehydroquinate synthase family protein [Prochlorococcus sp. MIT 1341]
MRVIKAYENTIDQYDIFVSKDLNDFTERLEALILKRSSIVLFIDSYVLNTKAFSNLKDLFIQLSEKYSIPLLKKVMEPGKHSKNLLTIDHLLNWLVHHNVQRDTLFIAVGGGVTGDIVGFLSTIYFRGVSLCHFPTNLLAMTDSSIGGKTAVNTTKHINSCGTYKHPEGTFIFTKFLSTLHARDFFAGFAEVIKISLLKEGPLLKRIIESQNYGPNLKYEEELVEQIIEDSIIYKLHFTKDDITEKSKRLFLNLGHTFAHSIESLQDLTNEEYFRHGEAVSLGLIASAFMGDIIYGTQLEEEITNILSSYNLPIRISPKFIEELSYKSKDYLLENLVKKALLDKKGQNRLLRIILLSDLFKPSIYTTDDRELIRSAFNRLLDDP